MDRVEIDTLWNVKMILDDTSKKNRRVEIDTLWNVKLSTIEQAVINASRNRYIVECKE